MSMKTSVYGFPKMGPNRELKKAMEKYWSGEITGSDLRSEYNTVNRMRLETCKNAGIDIISSGDFSGYDFMLDLSIMFGVIPDRFKNIADPLKLYYAMARGTDDAIACEMTKWFDTNYHYIVPELTGTFSLAKNAQEDAYTFAKSILGNNPNPVFVGPFTYISLSKIIGNETVKADESPQFESLVKSLAKVYNQLLKNLEKAGVTHIQLDEPSLVLEQSEKNISILIDAYTIVTQGLTSLKVFVNTYYESLSHYKKIVNELPVAGIGLDFVVNDENLKSLKAHGFPKGKILIAGIISGRNPWKTEYKNVIPLVKEIISCVGKDSIILTHAAPLFHLPWSLEPEKGHLDNNVIALLSFASERIEELKTIQAIIVNNAPIPTQNLEKIRALFANQSVQKEMAEIDPNNIQRKHPFASRYSKQLKELSLPLFPTTTIGSFPQTAEVRKTRAAYRNGKISIDEYESFINKSIQEVVKLQEEIGIDVLVHGEFERTDMVEFFGEKMDGFAFTKNGWVQSYGSRCVRPPIIYGDVSRPEQMTVNETVYAQSLTDKPMKGMLTGPVTIVNWSFYRNDIQKKDVAFQVALALKKEVIDLEKAGIKIIQIDEPAFREGLPLKKSKQQAYLRWAVESFRLTNNTVKESTQIHTHMCYSEFNEIIEHILNMDSDVISIEASRSKGEILEAFEKFNYNHGIGVGVYDIHSPRIPKKEEMTQIAKRSIHVIDKGLCWINPDCGLKTRGYEETIPALKNMVTVAEELRASN